MFTKIVHILQLFFHRKTPNIPKKFSFQWITVFFILIPSHVYSETEVNNDCSDANAIITPTNLSNSMTGRTTTTDKDYFYFETPNHGSLNVTISTDYPIRYSIISNDATCSFTTTTSLPKHASTSLQVNNTNATKYYIYVVGDDNRRASNYTISASLSIPNLTMSKSAYPQDITGVGVVTFTISLTAKNANFSSVDILDDISSIYDLSHIHNLIAPADLHCSITSDILTCTNGTINDGTTVQITFDVDTSDINATRTNTATYTSEYGLSGSASASVNLHSSGNTGSLVSSSSSALLIGISEHNIPYTYNNNNPIYTKIVDKNFTIDVTHLDQTNNAQPVPYTGNTSIDFNLYLVDEGSIAGSCGSITDSQWFGSGTFNPGDTIVSVTGKVSEAFRAKWLRSDTGVFSFVGSESSGSFQSSLCAVPASFNSATQIYDYYKDSYPEVGICTNGDGIPGTEAPCSSNAYFGSCGGKKSTVTISPSKYNHDLGCIHCLSDLVGSCTDSFAIRPKEFNTNIQNNEVFTAGKDYNKTIYANKYGGIGAQNYNESKDDSFDINITLADSHKICPDTHLKFNHFNFTDGIFENNNLQFNNIGDFNLTIAEINGSEFALIDQDDTPDIDRLITSYTIPIHIIPDHFTIDANLTDHNIDHNFTYLHDFTEDNTTAMGALLSIDIAAMGADENITTNYIDTCYAKETNLTLILSDVNITYPGSQAALTQFIYYNPNEENGTLKSYTLQTPLTNISLLPIENNATTFRSDAPEGNGTASIDYKLNFDRKRNLPVNPFKLKVEDINITDSDGVSGTDEVNQTATFYYARSRASQFFYQSITDINVTTPILIDVYCDLGFTSCDSLGIDTVYAQINEINWWLSLDHNATNGDGTIALTQGSVMEGSSSTWSVTPTVEVEKDGIDDTISVYRGNTPTLPLSVGIDFGSQTNPWLIYNPNDPILSPSPFYKVRFIGTSGWAGYGDTGHVVETNASTKKHNRLEW